MMGLTLNHGPGAESGILQVTEMNISLFMFPKTIKAKQGFVHSSSPVYVAYIVTELHILFADFSISPRGS